MVHNIYGESVPQIWKLLNFWYLKPSIKNSRNSASKIECYLDFRKKFLFEYTLRGYPLFWKFWKVDYFEFLQETYKCINWKIILHLPVEIPATQTRIFGQMESAQCL